MLAFLVKKAYNYKIIITNLTMDKQYKFSPASVEDQKAFDKGMKKLANELSLEVSLTINKPVINIKDEDGTSKAGFIDVPSYVLQKKTEIVVAEKTSEPVEEPIVEPKDEPTISPFVKQPNDNL